MEIDQIVAAIQANQVNVTLHARREARNDSLILDEILFSARHGEIIEGYPGDKPFPSCLVFGRTPAGDPVHSVWAYDPETGIAVLVTVYRPDLGRWIEWKKRRTP